MFTLTLMFSYGFFKLPFGVICKINIYIYAKIGVELGKTFGDAVFGGHSVLYFQ